MPAIIRHRFARVLLAALLAATSLLIARTSTTEALDDTFAGAFFVESSYLATYDHAILLIAEQVDATSVPDPADFTVLIGDPAIPEPILDVDFIYQGLNGAFDEFLDGVAFLELSWATDVPNGTLIRFNYTPGEHPLRDLAGNQMPVLAGEDLQFADIADIGAVPFVDEGAGPDTMVLFFAEPLQPDLPSPLDFSYRINGVSHAVTAVERREPHLGATLLYLALDTPIDPTIEPLVVDAVYTPELTAGSPPLRDRNGDPIAGFDIQAIVTLSATSTRQTDPGTDVVVAPTDETTGAQLATITFDSVTTGGTTTLTTTETAPALPTGFTVGDPPTYYEIATTATFAGSARVCIRYGAADYPDPPNLALLHFEGGDWVPVQNQSIDEATQTICGDVTSFSPFAVAHSAYHFTGFSSPVDNAPTVNVANGGPAIPVKFSLDGDFGLEVLAGAPISRVVACDSGAAVDTVEETISTNGPSLSYDAGSDRYQLVWKTQKSWAGSCRELVLRFADGSTETALFHFK